MQTTTQKPSIELVPVRQAGAFHHWEMSIGGAPPQGPPAYPQVTVQHGNNAEISITISNAQGIELRPYNPPASTPIYIQQGFHKPTGIDSDIKNIRVKDDPQTGAKNAVLKFHDGNQKAGQLTYVLNFKVAGQLDPIVNNGGGPGIVQEDRSTSGTLGVPLPS